MSFKILNNTHSENSFYLFFNPQLKGHHKITVTVSFVGLALDAQTGRKQKKEMRETNKKARTKKKNQENRKKGRKEKGKKKTSQKQN